MLDSRGSPLKYMDAEIEDWVRDSAATVQTANSVSPALLNRLRYVAAIVAEAGPLTAEPQLLYRLPTDKICCAKIGHELLVGRETPATLIFSDDLRLSRQHFRIHRTPDGERIEDLQSRNGTFVNSLKIAARGLCDGDLIKAGHQIFVFLRRENELS